MASKVTKIICFDIDGTLVKSDPSSNMVSGLASEHVNKIENPTCQSCRFTRTLSVMQ